MADGKPHPRISIEEMRHRFNKAKYWDRLKAGELEEHSIVYHPKTIYPEVMQRHPGAVSVTSRYRVRTTGQDVAEVHYFRLPDGSVIPGCVFRRSRTAFRAEAEQHSGPSRPP